MKGLLMKGLLAVPQRLWPTQGEIWYGGKASLPAMSMSSSKSPLPSAPASSFSILVVDDNVDALEMMVEALGLLGYEAHPAADVRSALEIAEEKRPNVALLDIGLPDMDGYELGKRLRQLPGLDGLRLVALTGYGQASDKARSSSLGFAAHLVKPIDLDLLRALLVELSARVGAP